MILYFDITKIPRTTTRAQWRKMDRWRRLTKQRLSEARRRALDNLVAFGSTMPARLREGIIDEMVNPPLLLGPHMDAPYAG